jgi:hypothetical protein
MSTIRLTSHGVLIGLTLLLGTVSSRAEPAASYRAASDVARVRAEQMLEAAGGRAAWRDLRSIHVQSVAWSDNVARPYLFEFWIDFEQPRILVRVRNQDMNRLRGLMAERGWLVKEGDPPSLTAFTPERLAAERAFWNGAFARNFQRLARGDPTLEVALGRNGRLEMRDQRAGVVAWMQLDAQGQVTRFGLGPDDDGTDFGPMTDFGPRRFPGSGRSTGIRFETLLVEASSAPPAVSFEPPADLTQLDP